jgi:prephenate dehydrogenase
VTVAVIGLGLMGGSLAYALRGFAGTRVGYDRDPAVRRAAVEAGAADTAADTPEQAIAQADLTVFCTPPADIRADIERFAPVFRRGSVVTELGGLKRETARLAESVLPPDVDYAGVHPMAGRELSGFANADGDLFRGTGFLITPVRRTKPETVERLRDMARHIGADKIAAVGPEEHDRIIAYTSDLMHVAAFGLTLSYEPGSAPAFRAGAFRDCTRVARSDPELWAALLSQNRDMLLPRLRTYLDGLNRVYTALESGDEAALRGLLSKAQNGKKELEAL